MYMYNLHCHLKTLKVNSWDKKHVEEPDFEQRLKGFSEAGSKLPAPEVDGSELLWTPIVLDTTLPLVHNALFYLMKVFNWQNS